ncbi:MAG TPA: hypothetical protein VKS43_14645 [Burkholderiales bacterium]|nr:hypothetical protein [Burkholderiales bacterium]
MFATRLPAASLLIIALLPGCATPGGEEDLDHLPAAQIAAIGALPELGDQELAGRPFQSLGKVEGVSCKRPYSGSTSSWEATILRTKYEAMKKGANAIADLACGLPERRSIIKLCLESIRCTANAIFLTDR